MKHIYILVLIAFSSSCNFSHGENAIKNRKNDKLTSANSNKNIERDSLVASNQKVGYYVGACDTAVGDTFLSSLDLILKNKLFVLMNKDTALIKKTKKINDAGSGFNNLLLEFKKKDINFKFIITSADTIPIEGHLVGNDYLYYISECLSKAKIYPRSCLVLQNLEGGIFVRLEYDNKGFKSFDYHAIMD